MKTKEEVLKACTITGNIVRLPDVQLDRKLYLEVSAALGGIASGGIGGTWSRKEKGFVFEKGYEKDLVSLMEKISGGTKINLKKEQQFFETPAELADWLVQLAEPKITDWILEPSAGRGAIVRAIWRKLPVKVVFGCEKVTQNIKVLADLGPLYCNMTEDFFDLNPALIKKVNGELFDTIIANPPFSKDQDVDHILKMYECLKEGGRIVTVASNHWHEAKTSKCRRFREFLTTVGAETIPIAPGRFKESGTMVASCVVIINK